MAITYLSDWWRGCYRWLRQARLLVLLVLVCACATTGDYRFFLVGFLKPLTLNIGFDPTSRNIDLGSRKARISGESAPSKRSILPYGSEAKWNSTVNIPNAFSTSYRDVAARFTSSFAASFTTIRFPPYEVPPPVPHRLQTSYPVFQPAPTDPSPGDLPIKSKRSCSNRYASTVSLWAPHLSTLIACPANGLRTTSKVDFPSSNNCQRGLCRRICFASANRASSASLWKRAVFCFSASRSIPNCILDASRCFERSLASPASLLSAAILPSVAMLASFDKASVLLLYGYAHTSASTATPKHTRAILSNSVLCFSLRCASTVTGHDLPPLHSHDILRCVRHIPV